MPGAAFAQPLFELGLEGRRNRMLQPLGLLVNLVPLHAEHFAQHALDQVVAQRRMVSHFAACRGQAHKPLSPTFTIHRASAA